MRALLAAFVLSACTPAWKPADFSEACLIQPDEQVAADGTRFLRTPEACFADLPDWPYEAHYVEIDGLRQGYADDGPADGPVLLLLHGQPSWSYLYRHMIPPLADAGFRVIAMDHLGFGRSDKPVDLDRFTFADHAHRLEAFIGALDADEVTLFAQDWGSIVGLYVAGSDLGRFDRIVVGNGGLPVVDQPAVLPEDVDGSNDDFHRTLMRIPAHQPPFFDEDGNSRLPSGEVDPAEMFGQWVTYARTDERFRPSLMLEALTYDALTPDEERAYDAPHPHRSMMAGPRSFPSLRDELIGITQDRLDALATYERPFLTLFGANDPGLSGEGDAQQWMSTEIPGAVGQPHRRFDEASHFLQDDIGPELAAEIIAFIGANP